MKPVASHNKTASLSCGEPGRRIYDLDRTQRTAWLRPGERRLSVISGGRSKPDLRLAVQLGGAALSVIGCLLLLLLWPGSRAVHPPLPMPASPAARSGPSAAVGAYSVSAPPAAVIADVPLPPPPAQAYRPAAAGSSAGSHFVVPPAAPRPSEGDSF